MSDGVDDSTPLPDEASASRPPNTAVSSEKSRWRVALRRLESALNQRAGSPQWRKYLLAFAFVLFIVISVFSFSSLPHGVRFHWWPFLAMVLLTTPLTVLANSAEFRVMGVINGHVIGWLAAARLTVIAGAANLLPLPGGVVIRTQALRKRGSSYKHALAANAAAGLAWIGMGCLAIAALFLAGSDTRLVALLLVVAGVAALAGTFAILRSVDRTRSRPLLLQLVVVEAFTVLVSGTRIFLAFRMIGLTASAAQSVALTASQIIAAAVGIFPAGLGLRELLAGGIGSAVHLPLNQSVAATASDRIAAQIGLALLAGTMLIQERRRTRSPVIETVDVPGAPSKLP